jgi:VanZ family protein
MAFAALLSLAVLKIVPLRLRPSDMLSNHLDHVVAYFVTGALIALAWRLRPSIIVPALILLAAFLEALQFLSQTRHARLLDFMLDASGAVLGASAVYLTLSLKAAEARSRN